MDSKELLQTLIDMHACIMEEMDKDWEFAILKCVENFDTDETIRIGNAFRLQGKMLMIQDIVEMLTSREDMQNIFGLEKD